MSVTLICLSSSGVTNISAYIVRQINSIISVFKSECGLVYNFSQFVNK